MESKIIFIDGNKLMANWLAFRLADYCSKKYNFPFIPINKLSQESNLIDDFLSTILELRKPKLINLTFVKTSFFPFFFLIKT